MKRIAITWPLPSPRHSAIITMLLDMGWNYVHLRYPEAPTEVVEGIVEAIPQRLHNRLTFHDHHDLAMKIGGGIHLNQRFPAAPPTFAGRLSASAHSAEEALDMITRGNLAYAILSPCFESISKPGYGSGSTILQQVFELKWDSRCCRIIGLGGITAARVPLLAEAGMGGYAVCGSIFDPTIDPEQLQSISSLFITTNQT